MHQHSAMPGHVSINLPGVELTSVHNAPVMQGCQAGHHLAHGVHTPLSGQPGPRLDQLRPPLCE
jgi:hypothetical protein